MAAARIAASSAPSPDRAWEEVYVAEGSDWFGWYGDAAVRPEEALFDELFRKHLRNVYLVLGDVPPRTWPRRFAGMRRVPSSRHRGLS